MSKSYNLECTEREIMEWLDNGKKVYIESGALNDEILSYSVERFEKRYGVEEEVTFTTSACVFPKEIVLSDDREVATEVFNGCLFVKIW